MNKTALIEASASTGMCAASRGLGDSPGDVCGKSLVTFCAGASVIGAAAAIQSSSSSRNASVPSLALSLASARASI
jgi:hypothetical protein